MKAFVTGGTGFIGKRVIHKLIERGYRVNALVRSESSAVELEAMGVQPIWGDITDLASIRDGMLGCDIVFHLAAWYKLGARDQSPAWKINVEGTRNVLELAHELGIPRIIYTSTLAVYGDTHGVVADENYRMPSDQSFISEYDRTKWLAHYEVALPLIEKGAPITIVMPGAVFGPGDQSLVGKMMQAYYRGLLFFFPGPDTVLSFTHVDDIAEAHILAAEKGKIGESYIITGQAMQFREIVPFWAAVSGKPLPWIYIPSRLLRPLAPLAQFLSQILSTWPELLSTDAIRILGATYAAQAEKAHRELGWQPQPLEVGLQNTFDFLAQENRPILYIPPHKRRATVATIIGASLGLLLIWKITKRRQS
jgi:dihydroflavonol-4-reductase